MADLTYANLPEWLVKFGTQYRASGALRPRSRRGTTVARAHGCRQRAQPVKVSQSPFGLLNLNASWRFSESTRVNLAVTNALDKTYWATLDYANYGEPRFALLTPRTKF